MKENIHPEYVQAHVSCSCGETFTTRSTKASLKVEICSKCHPFFTGKQKFVDSGGRVERFQRRHGLAAEGASKEPVETDEEKPAAEEEPEGASDEIEDGESGNSA
ncbi:MAG: 50S ribosomal protein L31 [Terriglobia bacterium]